MKDISFWRDSPAAEDDFPGPIFAFNGEPESASTILLSAGSMEKIAEATTLLYTVNAKHGKEGETRDVLTALMAGSRYEAGNVVYETYKAVDDCVVNVQCLS